MGKGSIWLAYFSQPHPPTGRLPWSWSSVLEEYRGKILDASVLCDVAMSTPFCRGGTASDAVILNTRGQVVGRSTGPCTNPWVSAHIVLFGSTLIHQCMEYSHIGVLLPYISVWPRPFSHLHYYEHCHMGTTYKKRGGGVSPGIQRGMVTPMATHCTTICDQGQEPILALDHLTLPKQSVLTLPKNLS